MTVAVQPMEAWRELWLFHRKGDDWLVDVLPPAPVDPELGWQDPAWKRQTVSLRQ